MKRLVRLKTSPNQLDLAQELLQRPYSCFGGTFTTNNILEARNQLKTDTARAPRAEGLKTTFNILKTLFSEKS